MQAITLSRRLACEIRGCSKTFRRKYERQRHIDSVHGAATPHNCNFCERQFRRADKLIDHLRRKHPFRLDSESMKTNSTISDSSYFSTYSVFSSPAYQSAMDVVPSDTLMKSSLSSASWNGRSTDMSEPSSRSNGQPSSWLGEWRSASPKAMQTGTSDAPICVDEPTPNLNAGAELYQLGFGVRESEA